MFYNINTLLHVAEKNIFAIHYNGETKTFKRIHSKQFSVGLLEGIH